MECLVQNKHQKEMNDKCSVGVTHFQLVGVCSCIIINNDSVCQCPNLVLNP